MIAFLIIVYVAVVLVLFKVLHIKPTAYIVASMIVAGVFMIGGSRGGMDPVGADHGQDGDEPVCGSARPLREGTGKSDLRPGQSTHEER